ncbi:MAG TPA: PQQ-dependent sugar dehydrogenase [Anaerolineales bacterium]|nr:PQQ-dependent sugar dehydrogenase [Anaerolineales bacterium]
MTRLRLLLLAAPLVACTIFSSPTPAPGDSVSVPTPTSIPPTAAPNETPVAQPTGAAALPPSGVAEIPPTASSAVSPPDPSCCALVPIVDGLVRPTYLTHAGDDRLFVLEQQGRIRIAADGTLLDTPFLDTTSLVGSEANEQGLLGLAFHPNYASNGQFFVNYTNRSGNTVVARFTVSSDPDRADPASAKILLTIDQPFENHNGGDLVFGPDGLLYIGMGDGGSAGDPYGNGQNADVLLGKMLRLNVDDPNAKPEIWAIGLRNPWRFSFDRATGDLFIGDVGQGDWEEIDYVPAPLPATGPNFGWNILEGTHRYSTFGDVAGLTGPVAEYSQNEGGCSVTGGYVYRGSALPSLDGVYFFGDYCSGFIWTLVPNGQDAWDSALFVQSGLNISSFGEDASGELYVVDHGGAVYKLMGK